MKRRPGRRGHVRRRPSLRLRLAAGAAVSAAMALTALALGIDVLVRHNLTTDLDTRLTQRAQAESAEAPSHDAQTSLADGDFREPLLEWHTLAGGDLAPSIANGVVVPILARDIRTEPGMHTATFGTDTFRVLTRARTGGGFISVGATTASIDATMGRLDDAELLAVPLLGLVVFGGSLLFVRGAMRPVERLRATAESIGGGTSGERFQPVAPLDELGRLAATFDQMLDRLDRARDRQNQLTLDASHELRTPLTVIEGETSLALRRPRSADEYRSALHRIAEEARHMGRALDDLLWLARTDRGASAPAAAVQDLGAAARAAGERFDRVARARGLRLSVSVPPTPVDVLAPEGWPDRLLSIVLDNACKYTPLGGRVQLVVEDDPPRLVVDDSGPGIPPEDRERLLRRFERGAIDDETGSGLGLAIADAVVQGSGATWHLAASPLGGVRVDVEWRSARVADREVEPAPG